MGAALAAGVERAAPSGYGSVGVNVTLLDGQDIELSLPRDAPVSEHPT